LPRAITELFLTKLGPARRPTEDLIQDASVVKVLGMHNFLELCKRGDLNTQAAILALVKELEAIWALTPGDDATKTAVKFYAEFRDNDNRQPVKLSKAFGLVIAALLQLDDPAERLQDGAFRAFLEQVKNFLE
jgi:hypothetical protein